jgi:hypothetical protein
METLGLPDVEDAWAMANNQNWDCPIVWHTVDAIGSYEFKHGTQKEIQQRFAETYAKFVQRAREGEIFMMPSNPQLPPPDKRDFKPATAEVRKQHMQKMREMLNAPKQIQNTINSKIK